MKQIRTLVLAFCNLLFLQYAYAQACYESTITSPSPFMGNNDEIFKLSDGSVWQVNYEYEYLYAYSPEVIICPAQNRLIINGKQLQITKIAQEAKRRASRATSTEKRRSTDVSRPEVESDSIEPARDTHTADIVETQIAGAFTGWEGETIFKLSNGQIWQQSSYAYRYHYAYMPKVFIFKSNGGYQMQVEGIDQRIRVVRLK